MVPTAEVSVVAPIRYRFRGHSGRIPVVETRDEIEVRHPPFYVIPKFAKWSDGFLFALSLWREFRRMIARFRPDLIDAHWGYPDGFAAVILARMSNLPVIVTVRGSDVNVFLKERFRGAMLRYGLRCASKVIAVSGALKREMVEQGIPEDKIVVIRNGVDSKHYSPKERLDARVHLGLPTVGKMIVCIGNLVSIKGQDVLLEAFLKLNDPECFLVFVGDGPMREELQHTLKRVSPEISAHVHFVGVKPHDEIVWWFGAADLVCLPSRNEGLPNVVLEALACGRPVVATRVGGVQEVIDSSDVGMTVPSEDVTALCDGLKHGLARAWDVVRIRNEAMKYSWDNTIRQCVAVWREVLQEQKG